MLATSEGHLTPRAAGNERGPSSDHVNSHSHTRTAARTAPVRPETPIRGKDGVMSAGASRRYPPELKEWSVRTVIEVRNDHESESAVMNAAADLLDVSARRRSVSGPADRDRHRQPAGVTSESLLR